MNWEQIVALIVTSLIGGIGATWAYYSKVVLPKLVDASLKRQEAEQVRLESTSAFAQKIDEILVNAGISTSHQERLTQLGQAEQILSLLHDDQQFIRDTLSKMLTDVAQSLRQLHLVVVRQNDLITALNITFQKQVEDEYSRREESSKNSPDKQ